MMTKTQMSPFFWRAWFRASLALFGLSLLAVAARAEITLTLDTKEGEKVSDIVHIRARADSPDGIDKVEFRVDNELLFTGTSTPYIFKWDTVRETIKEGEHTLSVTAFDSNGATKRLTIKIVVDNELSLGADALGKQALEALSQKELDTAYKFARRAMKAEPAHLAGCRAAAGVYAARRQWDKAVAALDKAKGLDESSPALLELASYRMQRALLPENEASLFSELAGITELRVKAANLAIQSVKEKYKADAAKPTSQSQQAIGDTLLEAGRYAEAIQEYGKVARAEDAPVALVNRLALALTLQDTPNDALGVLRPLVRAKKADAATRAIMGLAFLRLRQFEEAGKIVAADSKDQFVPAMIVEAYVYAATGRKKDALNFARDAVNLNPGAADAHYAYFMAALDPRDADRELAAALALAPFQLGPIHDYAVRIALSKRTDRFELALNLTDFLLKRDPNHVNTKLTQALLYLQTGKIQDAEAVLGAITRRDKAPDMLMALATYWEVKGNTNFSGRYLEEARKADAARFERQAPDNPLELLRQLNRVYYYRNGYFLSLSTLFPDSTQTAAAP